MLAFEQAVSQALHQTASGAIWRPLVNARRWADVFGARRRVDEGDTLNRGTSCSSCARRANTATRLCRPIHSKRASARTNARSAQRALIRSWATSVQTVAADSFPGQSGQRRTGKATTSSARIRRAPGSSTGPLIQRLTQRFRRQSGLFRPSGGSAHRAFSAGRLISVPLRYTVEILRVLAMFSSGFASSTTKSADLPAATVPS